MPWVAAELFLAMQARFIKKAKRKPSKLLDLQAMCLQFPIRCKMQAAASANAIIHSAANDNLLMMCFVADVSMQKSMQP